MLLVTGASGFVGRHLLEQSSSHSPASRERNYDILPVYHSNPVASGISVDLTKVAAVNTLFQSQEITGVIHLAAEARLAECEKYPDRAYSNNVDATKNLLAACGPSLLYFLFVSTDMVFKGDRAKYREEDKPDATSEYGQSKILAENEVKKYAGPWCIVRPALIYGAPIGNKSSSLSWTIDTIKSGNGHFFSDEIRTPVWVNDLVCLLMSLCDSRHQGIVHAGGPERLSRLDFANNVADEWRLNRENVKSARLSDDPVNAKRPRDLSLHSDTAHQVHAFTDVVSSLKAIHASCR